MFFNLISCSNLVEFKQPGVGTNSQVPHFRKQKLQTLLYNWIGHPSKWCRWWRKNWRRKGTTKVETKINFHENIFEQLQTNMCSNSNKILSNNCNKNMCSALTAIFDSADPLNEGKISMKEYLQVCQKNGIEVEIIHFWLMQMITDFWQNLFISVLGKDSDRECGDDDDLKGDKDTNVMMI